MGLFKEIFAEAWFALIKSRTRSALTMLGVVWGIMSVTLLIAYGTGFRTILTTAFDAFGKSAVICWPQQTSAANGGQRGGKVVRFEQADVDYIKATSPLVKNVSMETVKRMPVQYGERLTNAPIRGVFPEYGEVRNEIPGDGRWISNDDLSNGGASSSSATTSRNSFSADAAPSAKRCCSAACVLPSSE